MTPLTPEELERLRHMSSDDIRRSFPIGRILATIDAERTRAERADVAGIELAERYGEVVDQLFTQRERAERAEARVEMLEMGADTIWREFYRPRTELAERRLAEAVELLRASRAEIDRWGYGDFHYGPTQRDKRVLAALAAIDAFLASLGETQHG